MMNDFGKPLYKVTAGSFSKIDSKSDTFNFKGICKFRSTQVLSFLSAVSLYNAHTDCEHICTDMVYD